MLVNIGLIVLTIYLGIRIAGFLARKKILFEVVGVFLIITALVLSYFFLIMGKNIETTKDFVIMLVLILFVGIIGLLMIFGSKFNKNKSRK